MGRFASGGGGYKQAADLEGQHPGIEIGRRSLGGEAHQRGMSIDQSPASGNIVGFPRSPRRKSLREIEHGLHAFTISTRADKPGEFSANREPIIAAFQQRLDHLG